MKKLDWSDALGWLGDRLREPSTWAGIVVAIGTLLGRMLSPEWAALIQNAGLAVSIFVCILTREAPRAPPAA